MTQILFVGDGPRDDATVPHLVRSILAVEFAREFRSWNELRLHRGRGIGRKLRYAMAQVRDRDLTGLIATIDSDKAPQRERLRELQAAREHDRAKHAPFPAALGEACPHLEAWLLDDPVATRTALQLPTDAQIPTVREIPSPKDKLQELVRASPFHRDEHTILDILSEISSYFDASRCRHQRDTGFDTFSEDVKHEFRSSTEN
jgi:hypothetical protein